MGVVWNRVARGAIATYSGFNSASLRVLCGSMEVPPFLSPVPTIRRARPLSSHLLLNKNFRF